MSVQSALVGITLTAGDITTSEAAGVDINGEMNIALGHVADLCNILAKVGALMTTAGDSANATIVTAQLTALGISPLAQ
jgi:hypothetical protein